MSKGKVVLALFCAVTSLAVTGSVGWNKIPDSKVSNANPRKPNVVVIIADQWNAQSFGFAGNPDVKTPNLDKLAGRSVVFTTAVSVMPVCSPARLRCSLDSIH